MSKPVKFAVVLSGCGSKDGSEIHESVSALLAISNEGGVYTCFAPHTEFTVTDNATGETTSERRQIQTEAARIARGPVKDLSLYRPEDFDVLVFPGGLGVIKNLCDYAEKGVSCSINPDVAKAVISTHSAKKPIVALCIAPLLLALILKTIKVTIGQDKAIGAQIEAMGGEAVYQNAEEITVDESNKIITTPCYMTAQNISEVAIGVSKAIKESLRLIV